MYSMASFPIATLTSLSLPASAKLKPPPSSPTLRFIPPLPILHKRKVPSCLVPINATKPSLVSTSVTQVDKARHYEVVESLAGWIGDTPADHLLLMVGASWYDTTNEAGVAICFVNIKTNSLMAVTQMGLENIEEFVVAADYGVKLAAILIHLFQKKGALIMSDSAISVAQCLEILYSDIELIDENYNIAHNFAKGARGKLPIAFQPEVGQEMQETVEVLLSKIKDAAAHKQEELESALNSLKKKNEAGFQAFAETPPQEG